MGDSASAAVVGGGIAGLCAAHEFQRAGISVEVFEASDYLGGKIRSSMVGDRIVDAGPDTFLARAPEGVQLCQELGLFDDLVSPAARVPAYIHHKGELRALPPGTILGIPTDMAAVAESGLVSAAGIERAKADLTLPETEIADDCSLGWYCRQRLGDEITDRLIDPLLGGINASNIDELSLDAAFPALAKVARGSRSLLHGLREHRASIGPTLGSAQPAASQTDVAKPSPVFYSLPGGMASLVDRLVSRLENPLPGEGKVSLHTSHPIAKLSDLAAERIVLATPASTSATLLMPSHPQTAALLAAIDYTSVSQVTYEFDKASINPELDSSGVLFPRVDGLMATAATWLSSKWQHYATANRVLIRVSSGRANDTRPTEMTDEELTAQLLADLATIVEISAPPSAVRVQRWPAAFPQYTPGHTQRLRQINEVICQTADPAIRLAGAAYDGIGIPACIRSGRSAAADLAATDLAATDQTADQAADQAAT